MNTSYSKIKEIIREIRDKEDVRNWNEIATFGIIVLGFFIEMLFNKIDSKLFSLKGWTKILLTPAWTNKISPLLTRIYRKSTFVRDRMTSSSTQIVLLMVKSMFIYGLNDKLKNITESEINLLDIPSVIKDDYTNDEIEKIVKYVKKY